ncbi:polysaccharide lyase [Aromatoleum aromaticum]|uniref:polysaccharide lyase n=1 Tax=Aromatoleum aromaticum TaxID=551760 RepID=UPI00138A31B9|nr:hypothetical protein [Aromatoleum aromaticum]NMG56083.1 hypothetical protein [Aromatoleum aromaticum]
MRRIAALCICLSPAVGSAALTLSDGAGGMTCRHFATAAKMAWQQAGGDWADATGKPYGDKPYAAEDVPMARGRQSVSWDVTALVRAWQDHVVPPGAVLLRAIPGTNPGAVNFDSRESEDASARPELIIEWAGDTRTRSNPLADTHLPCSTQKSIGEKPVFQVKGDTNAILVFPFDDKDRRPIARAELRLSTGKVYHRSTSIGVYGPTLPGGKGEATRRGIAGGFPLDKGIERHPDVVFADRFESPDWMTRWPIYSKNSTTEIVASDDANRFERLDARALKVTVPRGKVLGLNAQYRFDQRPEGEPEAMYFRYYLRFGENWNPTLQGGKLPGFAGTYNRGGWGGRKANGTNGWSARGTFFRLSGRNSLSGVHRSIGSYVYHADMSQTYGSTWGWNQGPTGMLEKNRWYSIEQYVRMNTPGRNDGVLRAWVDGEVAFEKTDMRYRDGLDLKIESLWMNVYHGGTTPTAHDLTLYIDNLVIARNYIGPMEPSR